MPTEAKKYMVRMLMIRWDQYSAALCQVYDSIFGDVTMSRVKFNVNTEYAYIQNFKVLQSQYPCRKHSAGLAGVTIIYDPTP